jgi:hypothetical protein
VVLDPLPPNQDLEQQTGERAIWMIAQRTELVSCGCEPTKMPSGASQPSHHEFLEAGKSEKPLFEKLSIALLHALAPMALASSRP